MNDRQDGPPPTDAERAWETVLSLRDRAIALVDADWSRLADDDAADLPQAVEELSRVVEVLQVKVAKDVCDRGIPGKRGARSGTSYLQQVLRIGRGEAQARLRAADRFCPRVALSGEVLPPLYPRVAAAQAGGEISADHARVIATHVQRLPAAVQAEKRDEVEESLVTCARQLGPADVAKCALVIAAHLDPDGILATDQERRQQRAFTITKTSHGMYKVSGLLDPETANVVELVLATLGRPVNSKDHKDTRTAPQRNADAVKRACEMALDHENMPDLAGRRPQVVITTTLTELQARTGLAYLDNGDPVPVQTLIQKLCDADASLAVFNGPGEVLHYGRSRRTAPPGQRKAIEARDKGCIMVGCVVKAKYCQTMHLPGYAEGGATDIDTQALGCEYHHDLFDNPRSGWQAVMIDGAPHTIAPPWIDPTQTPRRNHAHDPPT